MEYPVVPDPSLCPSLGEFISRALAVQAARLPPQDDWDIFEACEVSVREQRLRNHGKEKRTLTYGELDFEALGDILFRIKYQHGGLQGGDKYI